MDFNKTKIQELRKELNSVLDSFGKKNNLKLEIGRITYDTDFFRTQIKAFDLSDNKDVDKIEFDKYCWKFHIPADWYGKEMTLDKGIYIVSGIATRAKKYPILLRNKATGKVDLKMSVSQARLNLKA